MLANMENSAVITGLEKVSFQSQRKAMPKNVHTTTQLCSIQHYQGNEQNPSSYTSSVCELRTSRFTSWISKRKRRITYQTANIHWIPENKREFQENIYFCFTDYAKIFNCVNRNKLWKILLRDGIPDHLTCLLRSLYAGQEATVTTRHGTMDWFQTGKAVGQGCISSACLFNFYAEYNMWNARLDEAQAGIKIARRRYQ